MDCGCAPVLIVDYGVFIWCASDSFLRVLPSKLVAWHCLVSIYLLTHRWCVWSCLACVCVHFSSCDSSHVHRGDSLHGLMPEGCMGTHVACCLLLHWNSICVVFLLCLLVVCSMLSAIRRLAYFVCWSLITCAMIVISALLVARLVDTRMTSIIGLLIMSAHDYPIVDQMRYRRIIFPSLLWPLLCVMYYPSGVVVSWEERHSYSFEPVPSPWMQRKAHWPMHVLACMRIVDSTQKGPLKCMCFFKTPIFFVCYALV